MDLPKVSFTKWYELEEYQSEVNIPTRVMGIYLVSKKSKKPRASAASSLDKDIIYIGMTTSSLKTRLRTLCKAIAGKKAPHTGGQRIYKTFGAYPSRRKKDKLYISYWAPFGRREKEKSYKDFLNMGTITFLEYKLLGRFYKKFGKTPDCNANRRGE